jgi:peptide/nickel transport system ATP-binding protein
VTEKPALEFVGLDVWFDERGTARAPQQIHTVKGLDLRIGAGERVGLVGESGCGKTTTILAAMGLLPASATVSGAIMLDGVNVIERGEASIRAHRWKDIAMVFQGAMSAFNPVKTIGWQIIEALEFHGVAHGRAAKVRTGELLELVGLPAESATRFPHEFSGGMKQRAVIAMALSCEPKVLLADEPTTALDVVVQDQILNLLVRVSTELGLALVLVTHDLGVVAQTCTRAAVMRAGEIVELGSVEDLYRRPQHPYTRELFAATPDLADLPMRVASAPTPARESAPLLEVSGLTVVYDRSRRSDAAPAVSEVSLRVNEGELVALVGQSGCGKTSTLQAVLGMERARSGSIRIDGTEVVGLSERRWRPLRRNVQMIYQDPYESLDGRFRVEDAVEEGLIIHRLGATAAERRARVAEALNDVGLDPTIFAERYPHELSGGQRQRVAIAASLALRPRLLLADEPVSMLDVSVRTGILELLDRLRHEHRMGILMITHDLSTAAKYADRIIVMKDARIEESGDPWQIVHHPDSAYTRRLLESIPSPDPRVRRSASA